jgi:hypothetical protein
MQSLVNFVHREGHRFEFQSLSDLKIIGNSNRAEGPLVSCTGRLTTPTGHPVPCASAAAPVTTSGRSPLPLPLLSDRLPPPRAPPLGLILVKQRRGGNFSFAAALLLAIE